MEIIMNTISDGRSRLKLRKFCCHSAVPRLLNVLRVLSTPCNKAYRRGRAFLREAAAPLLTLPSLFAIFPDTGLQASAAIEVPILLITGTHDFVDTGEALRAQFPAVANWDQFAPEETGHNLFIFPSHPLTFERIASWADQRVEKSRSQTKTVPFR